MITFRQLRAVADDVRRERAGQGRPAGIGWSSAVIGATLLLALNACDLVVWLYRREARR